MAATESWCDVCNGSYTIEDANPILDLCDLHRDQYQRHIATAALRSVIPLQFHHAHPRDLDPSIASWTPNDGGLYLYGNVGVGKTHAAAALLKNGYMALVRRGARPRIAWLNVPLAIMQTITATNRNEASEVWTRAQPADLLVIDDIGMETPKDWVRMRLYALVEHRLNQRLPTIVTSNVAPGDDLADRLGSPQIASRLEAMTTAVGFSSLTDRRVK